MPKMRMVTAVIEDYGNCLVEIDHQNFDKPLPTPAVKRGRLWLFRQVELYLQDGKTLSPAGMEIAAAGGKSKVCPLPWNAQIEHHAPLEGWILTTRFREWGEAPLHAVNVAEILWKNAVEDWDKRKPPSNIITATDGDLKKIDDLAKQNPDRQVTIIT